MTTAVTPDEQAVGRLDAADRCPLCQSSDQQRFVRTKDRTVVECPGCSLRALSPMPSLDELIVINDETVHPFFNSYLEDEDSYRSYFARKLDDLQQHQASGQLLDVGCGAGFFLDGARQRGYGVAGVDLSPVPVMYARDSLELEVALGSLYEYQAPDGAFDAVTIFQTIEHDPHPAKLTAELFRILAPGGVVMITTPAADGFVARVMGRRWFGYRNVEHVSFFTRKSLQFALQQAGFEILFLDVEHGKKLTMKYVLNRLINYYYDHRTFLRNSLRVLQPAMFVLGKAAVFEPWAHLYALARKPAASGAPPEHTPVHSTDGRPEAD